MKKIFTAVLFSTILLSCREKETGPDYAKSLDGNWSVHSIHIVRYIPDTIIQYAYNPVDSGHVVQLMIKKLDPIHINIFMRLSRTNGTLLYEHSFDTPLVQYINDEEIIHFTSNQAFGSGGYNSDTREITVSTNAWGTGEYSRTTAFWFYGKKR